MDNQRLRNLTTGRVHTDIRCIYEDLAEITGQKGLMTHMLPGAMGAVEPWLREHVTDPRFWDGEYDVTHIGEYSLPEPTEAERDAMTERYMARSNIILNFEDKRMSECEFPDCDCPTNGFDRLCKRVERQTDGQKRGMLMYFSRQFLLLLIIVFILGFLTPIFLGIEIYP